MTCNSKSSEARFALYLIPAKIPPKCSLIISQLLSLQINVTASYQSGMTNKLMKNKYTLSILSFKFKYITENGCKVNYKPDFVPLCDTVVLNTKTNDEMKIVPLDLKFNFLLTKVLSLISHIFKYTQTPPSRLIYWLALHNFISHQDTNQLEKKIQNNKVNVD